VELTRLLRARFAADTTQIWVRRFTEAGIPHSPLNTVEDVLHDPQTEARNMIAEIEHPVIGTLKVPNIPIKFSDTPGTVRLPPPGLGQHQDEIFGPVSADRDAVAPTTER
jgi:CoA:oxalate CoA-transferase